MTPSLLSTERRLITLFVGGAFLFLVIFEGVFLASRILFEEQFTEKGFLETTTRIERRGDGPRRIEGLSGESMRRMDRPPIGIGFITIGSDGTILGGQIGPNMGTEDLKDTIDTDFLVNLETNTITQENGFLFYKKLLSDGSGKYRVFIGESGYPISDILRDILRFLILDILIILPFYFIGRYFVRETLKPVEENIDTMSHFIHDAGHELKTPLAIVSGNLQILRDLKHIDTALLEESIVTIHSMSDSLDGLLELVQLKKTENKESVKLYDAFHIELQKEKSLVETKKLTVTIDIPKNASIRMDRKHFSLLFGNLVRNAIVYNKENGTIHITFSGGTIKIVDSGIGMEESHLQKIWERFYRVERSGKHPGTGIGLTIVKRIIDLYHWVITVDSKKDSGTTFAVRVK